MRSTGPVVAMVGITVFNDVIVHHRNPVQEVRVVVAGAIAGAALALAERVWPDGAVAVAWLGLVTVLLVRARPSTPAPLEAFADWYGEV